MATIPARNPAVPFMGRLQRQLQVGSRIKICGTMSCGCDGDDRININLQSGPLTYPRDNVALHLSVRPKDSTIVRNTYHNKQWQQEERSSHCPITPGQHYDIVVTVGCDSFAVSVNGHHYCDFRYRQLRFNCISYVCVEGQTTLKSVDLH